jgi:hypothetical protein
MECSETHGMETLQVVATRASNRYFLLNQIIFDFTKF